uniref:Centrosomin N-terminal motif 1 domain-containing protein n=1 Tax=Anser cygnoides TaxID=8845 RepID=A0A8B9EGM2_ANSCY
MGPKCSQPGTTTCTAPGGWWRRAASRRARPWEHTYAHAPSHMHRLGVRPPEPQTDRLWGDIWGHEISYATPKEPRQPPANPLQQGEMQKTVEIPPSVAESCVTWARLRRDPCHGDVPMASRMAGEDAAPRGTLHPPGAWPHPIPAAQMCPLRALEEGPLAQTQTLRDFEKHLNDLKKENFSLKLRIYFLEERVQQKGEGSRDDVYRRVSAPVGTGTGTGMGTGCCSVLDFPPVMSLCQD